MIFEAIIRLFLAFYHLKIGHLVESYIFLMVFLHISFVFEKPFGLTAVVLEKRKLSLS